jgi:hypothetical protein
LAIHAGFFFILSSAFLHISEAAFLYISEAAFLHISEAAFIPYSYLGNHLFSRCRKPHFLNAHVQVQAQAGNSLTSEPEAAFIRISEAAFLRITV